MRRTGSTLAATFALVLALAIPARAAAGDVDTSFGTAGLTTTDVSGPDYASSVAVQTDGKIVVAGTSDDGGRFIVLRYTASGTLDPTFGNGGIVRSPFRNSASWASAVALSPDGDIIAAGATGSSNQRMAVVRYTADGALDPSFSRDGIATVSFRGRSAAFDVAIAPDGSIVVAGTVLRSTSTFNEVVGVARLSTAGALDPSFSGDGKATVSFGRDLARAYGVVVQLDGRIVVAGATKMNGQSALSSWAVARLTFAGTPDQTFSGDGTLTIDFGTAGDDGARDVALQADGAIVVAGLANTVALDQFAVVRLTSTGAFDAGFSGNGKVMTSFGSGAGAIAVAIAPDGRIVVAGSRWVETAPNEWWDFVAVARYLPSGAVDTSFSGDGRAMPSFSASRGEAVGDVAITEGGIVLVGSWWVPDQEIGLTELEAA